MFSTCFKTFSDVHLQHNLFCKIFLKPLYMQHVLQNSVSFFFFLQNAFVELTSKSFNNDFIMNSDFSTYRQLSLFNASFNTCCISYSTFYFCSVNIPFIIQKYLWKYPFESVNLLVHKLNWYVHCSPKEMVQLEKSYPYYELKI